MRSREEAREVTPLRYDVQRNQIPPTVEQFLVLLLHERVLIEKESQIQKEIPEIRDSQRKYNSHRDSCRNLSPNAYIVISNLL